MERAFGMLKGRWRVLQKRLDSSLSFAVKTTIACVVLHNFCLEANDQWDSDNDDDSDNDSNDEDGGVLHDADEIRNLISSVEMYDCKMITKIEHFLLVNLPVTRGQHVLIRRG